MHKHLTHFCDLVQMFHPVCREVYEGVNLSQLVYCLCALELWLGHTPVPAPAVTVTGNVILNASVKNSLLLPN